MKLIISGIGPGSPELITLSALNAAKSADVIIVPRSKPDAEGIAEKVIAYHLPEKPLIPVTFPMTRNAELRDAEILTQLEAIDFTGIDTIFFPVIGD